VRGAAFFVGRPHHFEDKDQAREFFTTLTGLYKNLNYSPADSDEYRKYLTEIEKLERHGMAGTFASHAAAT
jgi:hypothetical protein